MLLTDKCFCGITIEDAKSFVPYSKRESATCPDCIDKANKIAQLVERD